MFKLLSTLRERDPKKTDEICVIGRQADGKSVCARVSNVKPHVCVQSKRITSVQQFQSELNTKIHLLICSSKVHRGTSKRVVPNCQRLMSQSAFYVTVTRFEGQDIMNYQESGPVYFYKCTCESKRYLYDLKKVLKNEEVLVVDKQLSKNKKVLTNITFSHYTKSDVTTVNLKKNMGIGELSRYTMAMRTSCFNTLSTTI